MDQSPIISGKTLLKWSKHVKGSPMNLWYVFRTPNNVNQTQVDNKNGRVYLP